MQRTKVWLGLTVIVFAVVGATGLALVSQSLHHRIWVSSWFAVPSKSFIQKQDVARVKIDLSENDKSHFKKLYRHYYAEGLGEENNRFFEYYPKNNRWRKASLTYNNRNYRVKIKGHGRTPYAHKFGNHVSFAVKFRDEPYPFYSKRINLIIYQRVQLKGEILNLIAKKFDLLCADFDLVLASIGDNRDYFFYVEERINNDFFTRRKLPMIVFNKGFNGSLINHGSKDNIALAARLKAELGKSAVFSSNLKSQIIEDFGGLNKAILNKNAIHLKQYVDLDYLSRLSAFRIVYGCDGHGFSPVNFEMGYDTISRLFYPIMDRDVYGKRLPDCQDPYTFTDSTRVVIPFWLVLNSDSDFRKKTNEKIDLFLSRNDVDSLTSEIKDIVDYYRQMFVFERAFLSGGFDGTSVIQNLKCLRESQEQ